MGSQLPATLSNLDTEFTQSQSVGGDFTDGGPATQTDSQVARVGEIYDVVVLPGEWVYCSGGSWEFVMGRGWWPKIVKLEAGLGLPHLKQIVATLFGLREEATRLSFAIDIGCTGQTEVKNPPVHIQGERELNTFIGYLAKGEAINLMVKVDSGGSVTAVPPTSSAVIDLTTADDSQFRMTSNTALESVSLPHGEGGQRNAPLETHPPEIGEANINEAAGFHLTPTCLTSIIRLADAAMPSSVASGEEWPVEEDPIGCNSCAELVTFGCGGINLNEVAEGAKEDKGKQLLVEEDVEPATPVNQITDHTLAQMLHYELNGLDEPMWEDQVVPGAPERRRGEREVGESSNWFANVGPYVVPPRPFGTGNGDVDEGGSDISDVVFQYCKTRNKVARSLADAFEAAHAEAQLATYDGEPNFDDAGVLEANNGGAILADGELQVRAVYSSKAELLTTVALYAIRRRFSYVPKKSDRGRVILVCEDPTCPWRLYGCRAQPGSDNFEIRTVNLLHTCCISTRANYPKKATAKVIGEVLKSRYAHGRAGPRASEIPELMLEELKVAITYNKGWRAREQAILKARGSAEESYRLIAVYMHLLRAANPGTVYSLLGKPGSNGHQQFRYLFLSLGASIAGMRFVRKVIVIDATAIRSKFRGCLMSACMQDGNFQIFPLAFAVVDTENEASWTWFFKQLTEIVPDAPDLVLVSDRHPAIYTSITAVYPTAFHGACAVHLERNVKKHFRVTGIEYLVRKAARAYTVGEFAVWYNEISRRSPACAEYLDRLPREHWTQAFCPARRYNIMSSNIAESWNHAIEKAIQKPIVGLVEDLRLKLMEWFCVRRAEAENMKHYLTANANVLLLQHQEASAGLNVFRSSAFGFQVQEADGNGYYVDLLTKSCTCNKFTRLGIPCCHAIAAARLIGLDPATLGQDEYTATMFGETYKAIIFPIRNICDEEILASIEANQFVPGTAARGPGRQRKRRFRSTAEQMARRGNRRCTICRQSGHNRATCSSGPGH